MGQWLSGCFFPGLSGLVVKAIACSRMWRGVRKNNAISGIESLGYEDLRKD